MAAPLITITEEVKDIVDDLSITGVTPERVYIHHDRIQSITGTVVWVQPIEQTITNLSRAKDKAEYVIDVAIFSKCLTDSAIDSMVDIADEIYLGLRRYTYDNADEKTLIVETPMIYSPDYLSTKNLFAAIITVRIIGTRE